jgi:photosystem II stability/assembly factor-like uncharacterized protein
MHATLMLPALLTVLMLSACGTALAADEADGPGFDEGTFSGLEMRSIGPALMAGRIADIAVHPDNPHVWYVAVGSGNVFKTTNSGTTWTPIFDDEDAYSIGCITLDPNDPDTVWLGTGENQAGRHFGYGYGVYRSRDGGASWEHMGLEASEHIGMIVVDPRDSKRVFVAAQGPLWSGGGERGLYRTTDGGATWEKVLGDGLGNTEEDDAYTGVTEVHMDPRNPDVLYAASWQRLRNVAVLMDGGPGSGIHKSEDGGDTWRELTKGLPGGNKGKIGMALSPQDPDVVYATIELANKEGGFWRSADGGESWEKRSDYLSGGTGPHYYQEIFASPNQFDRIYQMDVRLHRSDDGGKHFERMDSDSKHVDHHAMAFREGDPNYLLVGNDGGLYESFDGGEHWKYVANLPVTQFYKVSVDYAEPFYNVYAGAQDNSSQGGPSRTDNVIGIRNEDWFLTTGADGHQSVADPTDPNIVYASWQQGSLTRYDGATGEMLYIQPQPREGEPLERYNWDAPILISPHDPARIYHASHRVWRSENRGDGWTPISGDLTGGPTSPDRLEEALMGRTWSVDSSWDLSAMSQFHTITSLSESPVVEGLLYVGTDDGRIQVSEDGGERWRLGGPLPNVPREYFVNDIKADLHDADTVYVVVDDHKHGDYSPYVLKSTDRGRSWRSIASNLPDRHLLWRLVQDHVKPELLFLGTEFGVFFTVDGGGTWTKLGGGAPNIPFRDLAIQQRENDLVGATFGRSIYILDDYSPLREVDADMLRAGATFFPVRRAHWYVERRPLSCRSPGCVDSQGDAYYVAENPPFGAVFTYYLAEALQTRKQARQAFEKPLVSANEDVAFPGWDALAAEAREDDPAVVFTVRDDAGEIVRHLTGPTSAGFHRIAWDLRYPSLRPWRPGEKPDPLRDGGVLVAPGTFEVTMQLRRDGELTPVGAPRTVEVVSIREPTLPGTSQDERVEFARAVEELDGVVDGTVASIDAVVEELTAMKTALGRSTAELSLRARADDLSAALAEQRDLLTGDRMRRRMGDLGGPVPISQRLSHAGFGGRTNAYGPTPAQRESLRIARAAFAEVDAELSGPIEETLEALRRALDASGVPWTPGRAL